MSAFIRLLAHQAIRAVAWAIPYAWALALFLLDTGLVAYCLKQSASEEIMIGLHSGLLSLSRRCRVEAYLKQQGDASKDRDADGPPISMVDPSGGAFMVSRREAVERRRPDQSLELSCSVVAQNPTCMSAAPMHLHSLSSAERLQELRRRQELLALVLVGLTLAASLRLAVATAIAAGCRFLEHLMTYAIVTVRICLVVMLILF
eukprot:gnl/TRDRNA2_/TRDRNA2_43429_c1_seq1.p1 gnl/TRDRNA2_/TRDRNA2_43429_c1~~gnl/TRDRNA2_/TRDRNA2_43429_c1_seq1.p1  ORF type:complete len:216 (-),score=35.02 gnl/TRDRNA2_/TRDRNA2_43429_c1_seq1:209-820(-)